jgi:hypothetical protein
MPEAADNSPDGCQIRRVVKIGPYLRVAKFVDSAQLNPWLKPEW